MTLMGTLITKLYDKRNNVNFPMVNYPFLNSERVSESMGLTPFPSRQ